MVASNTRRARSSLSSAITDTRAYEIAHQRSHENGRHQLQRGTARSPAGSSGTKGEPTAYIGPDGGVLRPERSPLGVGLAPSDGELLLPGLVVRAPPSRAAAVPGCSARRRLHFSLARPRRGAERRSKPETTRIERRQRGGGGWRGFLAVGCCSKSPTPTAAHQDFYSAKAWTSSRARSKYTVSH